jgi:hypothetical protein
VDEAHHDAQKLTIVPYRLTMAPWGLTMSPWRLTMALEDDYIVLRNMYYEALNVSKLGNSWGLNNR